MDGWQFSDNLRGWIIKSSSPIPGSYKTLDNSIFVGFSPNTGHRICGGSNNRYWKDIYAYNLAEVVEDSIFNVT